jgi:hypothetical protein
VSLPSSTGEAGGSLHLPLLPQQREGGGTPVLYFWLVDRVRVRFSRGVVGVEESTPRLNKVLRLLPHHGVPRGSVMKPVA